MDGREKLTLGGKVSEPTPSMIPLTEVQRMIADAQASAIEATRQMMVEALGTAAPKPSDDPLQALVDRLANAIGSITAQQVGKKFIPPEIIVKRSAARHKMFALIDKWRERGVAPHYFLVDTIHFDDMLIPPVWINEAKKQVPQEIDWFAPPNEALRPMNEAAHEIFEAFIESIQEGAPAWAMPAKVISPNGLRVTTAPELMPRDNGADPLPEPKLRIMGQQTKVKNVQMLGKTAPPAQQAV